MFNRFVLPSSNSLSVYQTIASKMVFFAVSMRLSIPSKFRKKPLNAQTNLVGRDKGGDSLSLIKDIYGMSKLSGKHILNLDFDPLGTHLILPCQYSAGRVQVPCLMYQRISLIIGVKIILNHLSSMKIVCL